MANTKLFCQFDKFHSYTQFLFRNISFSKPQYKIVPSNMKNKSKSSQEWLTRQLNDVYVKKSRFEDYRCRSAFKLLEIDERFKILKPGISVVDCGAAPGSWTQVVVRKLKYDKDCTTSRNVVVAIDLQHMQPIKGAIVLKERDFTQPTVQEEVRNILPNKSADLVISDMAPKVTGVRDLDGIAATNLVYSAFTFTLSVLKRNGTFLCKTFDYANVTKMVEDFGKFFLHVKRVKPNASRLDSTEIFLLAREFKGIQKNKDILEKEL